jgi:hypothetical protein
VHIYNHLVPLVCCYYSVGYLSDTVDYSSSLQLECFTDVGVFPCISLADEEALDFTHVSVVPTEVTDLLGLCNPPCRGQGEPTKLGLLYPLL